MSKFRKKPVVIEATQWFKNGDHPLDHDPIGYDNPDRMTQEKYWDYKQTEGKIVSRNKMPSQYLDDACSHCKNPMRAHGQCETLEGHHIVCPGDWIITGIKGENYPCKPDIFEQTYEAVDEDEEFTYGAHVI